MNNFFNRYFNIKSMMEEKRKYKNLMARVEAMPEDYKFVFKKFKGICGVIPQETATICLRYTMI